MEIEIINYFNNILSTIMCKLNNFSNVKLSNLTQQKIKHYYDTINKYNNKVLSTGEHLSNYSNIFYNLISANHNIFNNNHFTLANEELKYKLHNTGSRKIN